MSSRGKFYGQIEKVLDLPFYTEGPVVDDEGNLYFSTLAGGTIQMIDSSGYYKEWAKSSRPNGQFILSNGDHIVCDGNLSAIWRFDKFGQLLKDEVRGSCSNVSVYKPNDIIADDRGNIYFTDSIRHEGKVFFIGADGDEKIFAQGLDYPNGLVFSKDQKSLYIAESYKNRIIVFDIEEPGIAKGEYIVFSNLPDNKSGKHNLPDGLTIDNEENIWVAHYGMQAIQIVSPEGKHLYSIDTGIPLTSNLVFINKNTLLFTGGFGEPGPGVIAKYHLQ